MKVGTQSILIGLAGMLALATAAMLILGLLKPVAPGTALPANELASWESDTAANPALHSSEAIRLSITPRASQQGDRVAPVIRIEGDGAGFSHQLEGQFALAGMPHKFGILRLAPGQPPAVLLATPDNRNGYCCEVLLAAAPVEGGMRTVRVGELAGDGLQAMPTDISGDGIVDFILPDRAFSGAFGSVADSPLPSRIVNIVGEDAVDVSAQPQFASLFQQEMAQFKAGCAAAPGAPRINPACAAYVAAAARLGLEQAAWAQMLKAYDREAAPAFPADLKRLLIEGGYLPPASNLPVR